MKGSAVAAQTKLELAMTLRRGESLLVTLAIPIGILVFFGKVNPLSSNTGDPIAEVGIHTVEVEVTLEDAGAALHVAPERLPAVLVWRRRADEA